MSNITCLHCNYENPENSLYCQHCGSKLKKHLFAGCFKRKSSHTAVYGMNQKGSSLAPLGGMAIANQAKQFDGYRKNKTFPKIPVQPLENGIWYCPLCGDKNTEKTCKGCGFSRS